MMAMIVIDSRWSISLSPISKPLGKEDKKGVSSGHGGDIILEGIIYDEVVVNQAMLDALDNIRKMHKESKE